MRLAILYGSFARGEEDEGSDLDLLVAFDDPDSLATTRLASYLEEIVGRVVDVVRLDAVEERAPTLLERALDSGRVLVDRDELWPRLLTRRRAIRARADRAYQREMATAGAAVNELTG